LKWLLVGLSVACLQSGAQSARCDREPEGRLSQKSPVDGRFRIKVSGNPEKYVPGEVYTGEYNSAPLKITIQSKDSIIVTRQDAERVSGARWIKNDLINYERPRVISSFWRSVKRRGRVA